MRDLANIAADALAWGQPPRFEGRDLPDHEQAMARSEERARQRAAELSAMLADPRNRD